MPRTDRRAKSTSAPQGTMLQLRRENRDAALAGS
jgi:hypothetical protein